MNTRRWSVTRFAQVAGGLALAGLLSAMPVAQAATETNAARISVAVVAQADVAARSDGADTYVLTVTNRGGAMIQGLKLSVPIEAGYRLAEASFDHDTAWVSALSDSKATIRIEGMRGVGDTLKGTLRFTGSSAKDANALAERVSASWKTEEEDFSAQSNLPVFGTQALALSAAAAGSGAQYRLSSDIFAVGEPVSYWYTSNAGVSTPLVIVRGVLGLQPAKSDIEDIPFCTCNTADALGAVALPLNIGGIPAGSYTIVAHGNWSGATATAAITIP